MALNKDPRGQLDHTWRFDGLGDAFSHAPHCRDAIADAKKGTAEDAARDDEIDPSSAQRAPVPAHGENPFTAAAWAAQALLATKAEERDNLRRRVQACEADIENLSRFIELAHGIARSMPELAAPPALSDADIAAALASLGGRAPLRKIIGALNARDISIDAQALRKRLVKGAQFVPQGKSWRLTDS